jgi:hypothetical protein
MNRISTPFSTPIANGLLTHRLARPCAPAAHVLGVGRRRRSRPAAGRRRQQTKGGFRTKRAGEDAPVFDLIMAGAEHWAEMTSWVLEPSSWLPNLGPSHEARGA